MTVYSDFLPTAALDAHGLYASHQLPDGRWLCVQPLTYQRAQLALTERTDDRLDLALRDGYAKTWDYPSREAAIVALEMWDGNPTGWTRRHVAGVTTRALP